MNGAGGGSLPSVLDGIGLSGTKALHRARRAQSDVHFVPKHKMHQTSPEGGVEAFARPRRADAHLRYPCTGRFILSCASPFVIFICTGRSSFLFPISP